VTNSGDSSDNGGGRAGAVHGMRKAWALNGSWAVTAFGESVGNSGWRDHQRRRAWRSAAAASGERSGSAAHLCATAVPSWQERA